MKNTATLPLLALATLAGCSTVTTGEMVGLYSTDLTVIVNGSITTPDPLDVYVREASPSSIAFDPSTGCELVCNLSLSERGAHGVIDTACVGPSASGPIAYDLEGTCDWYSLDNQLLFDVEGTATLGSNPPAVLSLFGTGRRI